MQSAAGSRLAAQGLLGLGEADAAMPDRARAEARSLTVVSEPDRALRELCEAPYVLIRPDQHVAWCSTIRPSSPAPTRHITDRDAQLSRISK